jgi:hypothetical protein
MHTSWKMMLPLFLIIQLLQGSHLTRLRSEFLILKWKICWWVPMLVSTNETEYIQNQIIHWVLGKIKHTLSHVFLSMFIFFFEICVAKVIELHL